MSDPVTNAEVEDVLSSIRRLVSEDKRPKAPLLGPEPAGPDQDKLVLTPALRIAEEPPAAPDQTEPEQQMAEDAEMPADPPMPTPEPLPEVRQEVPDLSDLLDREDDVSFEQSDEDDEVVVVTPPAESAEDMADDYSDDPYNFDADEDDGASDPDEMSALSLRSFSEDDQPDFAEETENPEGEGDILTDLVEPEEEISAEPADEPDGEAFEEVEPSPETALTAKIEALETAIGKIEDGWEPDGDSGDENAGVTAPSMNWPDEGESASAPELEDEPPEVAEYAEPQDEPMPEPEADWVEADTAEDETAEAQSPTATGPTLDIPIPPRPAIPDTPSGRAAPPIARRFEDPFDENADSQLIDEEALRDLVSEIVRSELQGALGERITRNVRKLVRREIHRALTAQELE